MAIAPTRPEHPKKTSKTPSFEEQLSGMPVPPLSSEAPSLKGRATTTPTLSERPDSTTPVSKRTDDPVSIEEGRDTSKSPVSIKHDMIRPAPSAPRSAKLFEVVPPPVQPALLPYPELFEVVPPPAPSAPPAEMLQELDLPSASRRTASQIAQLTTTLTKIILELRVKEADEGPSETELAKAIRAIIGMHPDAPAQNYLNIISLKVQTLSNSSSSVTDGLKLLLSDRALAVSLSDRADSGGASFIDVIYNTIIDKGEKDPKCILNHVKLSLDLNKDNYRERLEKTISDYPDIKKAFECGDKTAVLQGLEQLYVDTIKDIVRSFGKFNWYHDARSGELHEGDILYCPLPLDETESQGIVDWFHDNLKNAWRVHWPTIPCKHSIIPHVLSNYFKRNARSKIYISINTKLHYVPEIIVSEAPSTPFHLCCFVHNMEEAERVGDIKLPNKGKNFIVNMGRYQCRHDIKFDLEKIYRFNPELDHVLVSRKLFDYFAPAISEVFIVKSDYAKKLVRDEKVHLTDNTDRWHTNSTRRACTIA